MGYYWIAVGITEVLNSIVKRVERCATSVVQACLVSSLRSLDACVLQIHADLLLTVNSKPAVSGSDGGEYEMALFWVVAPCMLVKVCRRLRGASSLYHHSPPFDGGSKNL